MCAKLGLKKGDDVEVITGKENGKRGKILKVNKEKGLVFVEKLNLVKKHTKPSQHNKGGIIEKEAPIHISNVMKFCNTCMKPVRIGKKTIEKDNTVRICVKCKEQFE